MWYPMVVLSEDVAFSPDCEVVRVVCALDGVDKQVYEPGE